MRSRIAKVAVFTFALVSVASAAEQLPRPTAEYQANLRIEAGALVVFGPVHYSPQKERRMMRVEGSRVPATVVITRRDKGIIWVLNPRRKSYYAVPIKGRAGMAKGAVPSGLLEKVKVRPEIIDGNETTKYKVKFAKRGQSQLVGHIWVSADNILVKVEGETFSKGRSRPFRRTLENLKIGPQPAALFEVPKEYVQVPATHPTLGIMAPPPRRNGAVRSPSPQENRPTN